MSVYSGEVRGILFGGPLQDLQFGDYGGTWGMGGSYAEGIRGAPGSQAKLAAAVAASSPAQKAVSAIPSWVWLVVALLLILFAPAPAVFAKGG